MCRATADQSFVGDQARNIFPPDGGLHQVCFWSETGGEGVLLQDAREGVAVFVRSRWWGVSVFDHQHG